MPLDYPAAVFRCDTIGCDAMSVVSESEYPVRGAELRLPNGWYRVNASDEAAKPWVLCSAGCLKTMAIRIAEPPF